MKTVLASLAVMLAGAAAAQDYPAKPVRVIVPYVAGGNADIWARTLAQKLTEAMRQSFVVENKPGANGGIGTDYVAESAPALAELLGGQLRFMFDTVITSVPHIHAGKLRAFAVSSAKRASPLPEVPTMQEAGFAGFDMSQWQGVLAPAGTPRALIGVLNAQIAKAMHAPDVYERIAVQGGNDIVTGTPEEFGALIRADLERYARLIRDAKISAQ